MTRLAYGARIQSQRPRVRGCQQAACCLYVEPGAATAAGICSCRLDVMDGMQGAAKAQADIATPEGTLTDFVMG